MQGIALGTLIVGYCCWYTLYQRTYGDGSSFLYNLTGSIRFPGPINSVTNTTPKNPDVVSGANNQGGQGPPGGRH